MTLAEDFEAERPHLLRVDPDEIRDLRGWLTTTVSRLALDQLRSPRVRREAYVGRGCRSRS